MATSSSGWRGRTGCSGSAPAARRPGTAGVIALAWTHMLRVATPTDPALRAFAQFWLGRGAPHASGTLPNS